MHQFLSWNYYMRIQLESRRDQITIATKSWSSDMKNIDILTFSQENIHNVPDKVKRINLILEKFILGFFKL